MKARIHTFFFFIWLWIVLIATFLLLLPLLIFKLPGLRSRREAVMAGVASNWARHLVWTSGSKIELTGLEHLDTDRAFCLMANHQGNFDVPLVLASIPTGLGFIAKKELARLPFVSSWMRAIHCVFIDRKSMRDSIAALRKAAAQVKAGISMVLFPEATRSRTGAPQKFHAAGIRIMVREGIPLLPVTIHNSRAMLEERGLITPVRVRVEIHPLMETAGRNADEVLMELETTITGPLLNRNPGA